MQSSAEAQRRLLAERGSPGLLGHHLDPTYELYPHVRLLSQKALDLVSGRSPRQLWSLPPQHSKSETGARRLPLWFLDWFPTKRVVIASYSADLAHGHGRWIRNAIRENQDKLRVSLSPDSRAAYRWNTPQGGGLLATGVGGSLTGFPADLIVIDDPFASWDEAQSEVIRRQVYAWYHTVARTRLQKGGSVLCIQTRWHPEDLIGMLKAEDAEGRGEGWEHVRLPAIADHDPDQDETDPLGREPGEVLCPELHPLEEIQAAMRSAGPFLTAGLYQQHPVPPEGNMFASHDWQYLPTTDSPPHPNEMVAVCRAWDTAATEGGGDYTVGTLMGRNRKGRTFVLDVVRDRRGPAGVELMMRQTSAWDRERFGRRVAIRFERAPGDAGKVRAEQIVEEVLTDFINVESVPSSGSKATRAMAFAAAVADHVVTIAPIIDEASGRDGSWVDDYVEEHGSFPVGGQHDDQVDASSLAYNTLRKLAYVARPITLTSSAGVQLAGYGI